MDQLMNFAWKFMLPLVLFNLVAAAIWHFMAPGAGRWFVGFALVIGPYLLLGRALFANQHLSKRTYRYAE
jgi:NADH-quinone oxidoreductase subunit H